MTAAVRRSRLRNGITLLRCPGPGSRVAAVTVAVPLSTAQVPVAHLLADLWRGDPATRERLSRVGARVEPLVTPDCVGLRIEAPVPALRAACAVLPDLVITVPPQSGLERARHACATRISAASYSDNARALDLLRSFLFGSAHRYGVGTAEQIAATLSCQDARLREHAAQLNIWAPTVAVCGDPDDAPWLDSYLEEREVRPRRREVVRTGAVYSPGPRTGVGAGRQASCLLGTPGVALGAPERAAVHLAGAMLGARHGMLERRLRRKQAVTYSITVFSREFADSGYCVCVVHCPPEAVGDTRAAVHATLSDLAEARFTAADLDHARRRLTVAHHLGRESCGEATVRACCHENAGVAARVAAGYPESVDTTTREQVQRVAARLFRLEESVELCLTPAGQAGKGSARTAEAATSTTTVSRDVDQEGAS